MARILPLRERALQSRDVIELLSSKWRITIIHILRDGRLRSSEIQQAIPDVSPKVLTETLRGMERDGLIERRVFRSVPAHVDYGLTPLGDSLIEPLRDLCHWAKAHVAERDAARRRFDYETIAAPSAAAARTTGLSSQAGLPEASPRDPRGSSSLDGRAARRLSGPRAPESASSTNRTA